jgi:hypothetical protein
VEPLQNLLPGASPDKQRLYSYERLYSRGDEGESRVVAGKKKQAPGGSTPAAEHAGGTDTGQGSGGDLELKQACQEFERLFVAELVKQMIQPAMKSAFGAGGKGSGSLTGGSTILTEILIESLSKDLARSLDLGLSKTVYEAMMDGARTLEDGGSFT